MNNPNLLLDDVTVIDHALTHPWTVLKSYRREPGAQPVWTESVCAESNNHVQIGSENYMLSGDGYLMPTKKGQRPPDLKYFTASGKSRTRSPDGGTVGPKGAISVAHCAVPVRKGGDVSKE